jgi:hypothetical protein
MMDNTGAGKLLLSNGRSPAKKSGDYVTRQQVEAFVTAYVDAHIEHYMRQIPELVATMLATAFEANGLTLQGPPESVPTDAEGPE